jgi:hypothetical protein
MPYKCEKINLPRELDRRVKLTEDEREEIKQLYGKISQRKLAKRFGVSRRLIIFIGAPEKYQHNKDIRKDSTFYYNKYKHRAYMKKHRKYKQRLYLEGKIKEVKT